MENRTGLPEMSDGGSASVIEEEKPIPGIVIYLICVFSVSGAFALLCLARCLYLKMRQTDEQDIQAAAAENNSAINDPTAVDERRV